MDSGRSVSKALPTCRGAASIAPTPPRSRTLHSAVSAREAAAAAATKSSGAASSNGRTRPVTRPRVAVASASTVTQSGRHVVPPSSRVTAAPARATKRVRKSSEPAPTSLSNQRGRTTTTTGAKVGGPKVVPKVVGGNGSKPTVGSKALVGARKVSENGCPPYERIVKNVHPIATKGRGGRRTEEDGDDVCRCTVEQQCGEQSGCLNRSVYVECAEEHGWDAGAGIRLACENRKFTHRKYRQTVPFPTESKGWGLRAEEAIPAGSFIIEYVGEVISLEDSIQRMTEDGDARHHYFMSLNNGSCIDASRKGNRSRFINHSCSPNAVTQKWMVDRKPRIGIFALSDIASGEEITFDYQFENFGMKRQKCHCGHAGCRGVIGGKRPDSIDHSKIYQLSGRIAKLALLEPIVPTLPPVAEQKRLVLSYLSGSPSQRCRFFQHCPVFLLRNLQLLAAVVERQINLMALLHEPDPSGRRSSRALSTGSSSSFSCKSPTLRIRPINVEVSRIWNLHAPPIRISPFSSPSSASSSSIVDYRWLTDLVKAQFVQDSPNPSSRCARPMNTTVTRRRLQRKHTPAQRLVNS